MTSPINIGTHRLINLGADSRQSLSKFTASDLTTRNTLVIKTTELLELTGLQALELAVDSFDKPFKEFGR